jgi:hypothetical protein
VGSPANEEPLLIVQRTVDNEVQSILPWITTYLFFILIRCSHRVTYSSFPHLNRCETLRYNQTEGYMFSYPPLDPLES